MQTLRKLPTMLPKAKNTTDQKWNGTRPQTCASKIGLMAIDVPFKRDPHHVDWRGSPGPQLEGCRALVQQHAEPVGRAATGGSGGFQESRFRRPIDHVVGGM